MLGIHSRGSADSRDLKESGKSFGKLWIIAGIHASNATELHLRNLLLEERVQNDGCSTRVFELPHPVKMSAKRRGTGHEGMAKTQSHVCCREIIQATWFAIRLTISPQSSGKLRGNHGTAGGALAERVVSCADLSTDAVSSPHREVQSQNDRHQLVSNTGSTYATQVTTVDSEASAGEPYERGADRVLT